MNDFLRGALSMGCWVAGLLFLRSWRETGERLFAFFAAAFWVFALNWLLLVTTASSAETRHHVYIVRLVAFLIIIYAIWDKNRAGAASPSRPLTTKRMGPVDSQAGQE